jgi:pimeloyl-ACP methyl ester carboxylesterase
LVPPMTASAAGWVDLVAAMRELGPVVSADPPGTLSTPRRSTASTHGGFAGTITAFASATAAMFVDQRSTMQLLDRVRVPVLLLWGTDDPLIDQPSHRLHAQRPGWTPHPIAGAGHLLPIERTDEYVAAVRAWMPSTSS